MSTDPLPSLYDLLIACSVKITVENGRSEGTGFFVAPSRVLTCAHVMRDGNGNLFKATIRYGDRTFDVANVVSSPTDLSLLEVRVPQHPCVLLRDHFAPREQFFFYGFPGRLDGWRGEGGNAQCDGPVTDMFQGRQQEYIKFTPGGVRPGMSGAPLLNESTGTVCGVVKRTRNPDIDQGGLAIPMAEVWKSFPELRAANQEFHRTHPDWHAAFQSSGAALAQLFARGPAAMADKIPATDFETLINSRTEGFVGRDSVFAQIDATVNSMPSGYVIITGEPGLGKTALMAQLVKTRGYVHHFNVTGLNIKSPRQFVENITAQISIKYGLSTSSPPQDVSKYGRYLDAVLKEAIVRNPGTKIIVLVDALNEASDAELPIQGNRLFLPPTLPNGVYVIATSRPASNYKLVVSPLSLIQLKDDSPDNRKDVQEYISRFFARHRERMTVALKEWGVTEERFEAILSERSQGNFMYLKYVLIDIRDARLSKETIGDVFRLPIGITEYYHWHWRWAQQMDPSGFESATKPVVCMFATAKEPVSVEQVVRWTQDRWPKLSVNRIIGVVAAWRPFLDEYRPLHSVPVYRIYHISFQEFLRDVVGLGLYHDLIIESALKKMSKKLPGDKRRQ